MPNKNKKQGTDWEREVVNEMRHHVGSADRHPLRGIQGEPDVWAGPGGATPTIADIYVVAWKRFSGSGKRRKAHKVAVVDWEDFLIMAQRTNYYDESWSYQIQCKATERLNVVDTLNKLKEAVKKIWSK